MNRVAMGRGGAFVTLLALGMSASAQVVHGRTLSPIDSSAVSGVLMQVTDTTGRVVTQMLTDARGYFTVRLPVPGVYQLRGLRVGWHPSVSASFAVSSGETIERSLMMTGGVVVLTPSRVTAKQRCASATDSSSSGFTSWEEARKALTASLLTRTERSFALRWVQFERETNRRDGSVTAAEDHDGETRMLRPFATVGIHQLAVRGYVDQDSTGTSYVAPDEEVLLSDEFAESHCIHAVAQPTEADSIMIAFEPVPDRAQPDVAGTFVMERRTAELRRLAFHYVNLPSNVVAEADGEVHFRQLPGGRWLVDSWWLNLPVFDRRRVQTLAPAAGAIGDVRAGASWRDVWTATKTIGGEIYWISNGTDVVWRGNAVTLRGRLVDSLGVPAAAAIVSLRGTSATARTDAAGAFLLIGVHPGRRVLSISPSYRDSLGIEPFTEALQVDSTSQSELLVLIPVRDSVASALCPGSNHGTRAKSGFVRGTVRDSFGGRLGANDVIVSWPDGGGALGVKTVTTRSSVSGDYRACGLPLDTPLTLTVHRSSSETGTASARIPIASGVALVDVHVGSP